MYDLNILRIFIKVVENEGFTAAAKKLDMPKSKVSRLVSKLEGELSTQLFERTTRHVRLTEAGEIFYQYAQRILSEAESAEHALDAMKEYPSGLLRISTTHSVGQHLLAPKLSAFTKNYKDIELDIILTNRKVDLIEENFDVVLRAGALKDSNLISKKIGNAHIHMYASKNYLAKFNTPQHPKDLNKHTILGMSAAIRKRRIDLKNNKSGEQKNISLNFSIKADDFGVLYQLANDDCGITLLPHYMCESNKNLVQLLPDWQYPPTPFYVVYPSQRGATPKLRAFIDFLSKEISPLLK